MNRKDYDTFTREQKDRLNEKGITAAPPLLRRPIQPPPPKVYRTGATMEEMTRRERVFYRTSRWLRWIWWPIARWSNVRPLRYRVHFERITKGDE